ncbi:MAG: hypothetical protein LHV68_01660 [Elusimicrobia bacterium]|nr:hypothetical protein [Candidatus Liberimonas magnetica]
MGFVTPNESYEKINFSVESHGKTGGGIYVICCTFTLVAVLFLPLGCAFADIFKSFEPLKGYSINIVGNLVGVLLFTLLSFLHSPPYIWFLVGLTLCLIFLHKIKWIIGCILVISVLLVQVYVSDRSYLWSPYQKIAFDTILSKDKRFLAKKIFVNNEYHQTIIDIDKDYLDRLSSNKSKIFTYFIMPYQYLKPENVLIIAAGAGNEAAAALKYGVKDIDAVEIDPIIITLGKRDHPQKPYQNKFVNVINDDARAYLARSNKKYDLIVQNQLDSHSQYAMSANLRLDSYLYTLESFKSIKDHLTENGVYAITFSREHWYMAWSKERFIRMIETVFGHNVLGSTSLFEGEFILIKNGKTTNSKTLAKNTGIPLATDDWPQFYLKEKRIPMTYLAIMGFMLLFSVLLLLITVPGAVKKLEYHFFFLGAGFLLLEIKNISQFALLFGNTWIINSIVLSAVLVAILFSNYYVTKNEQLNVYVWYLLLFSSLLLNYLVPHTGMLKYNVFARILFAMVIIGLPVYFAGVIFASSFAKTADSALSLGSNILGCIVGGMGEYISMYSGIRNLTFVIMFFYLLSFLPILRMKVLRTL